ncbi:hypothetical protein PAXRUDRAFT_423351 [Paxillus rubicundulus Ve08.2h10]|uniref:Uncharacterized protein n=1 Tax=Paxillus rubicundulus Ve08.2h10 TaxID=930991 RepID=A0A0D0E9Z0_9AGAM|nr:hypothetical protein PAXRUDRAFT_423351 [Paxillus rubicundulus Ve08.2h10]
MKSACKRSEVARFLFLSPPPSLAQSSVSSTNSSNRHPPSSPSLSPRAARRLLFCSTLVVRTPVSVHPTKLNCEGPTLPHSSSCPHTGSGQVRARKPYGFPPKPTNHTQLIGLVSLVHHLVLFLSLACT